MQSSKHLFCFRNHEHGALNIYNSENITMKNCTFHNNTSDSFFTRQPSFSVAASMVITSIRTPPFGQTVIVNVKLEIQKIPTRLPNDSSVFSSNFDAFALAVGSITLTNNDNSLFTKSVVAHKILLDKALGFSCFKIMSRVFRSHVAVLTCENHGMCDPEKYNHKNPVCSAVKISYHENFHAYKEVKDNFV